MVNQDYIDNTLALAEENGFTLWEENGKLKYNVMQYMLADSPEKVKRVKHLLSKISQQNRPLLLQRIDRWPMTSALRKAQSVEEAIVPQTASGKLAAAGSMAAGLATGGASFPIQAGAELLAGGLGGGAGALLDKSSVLGGTVSGLEQAAIGVGLGGALKGAKGIVNYLARPSKVLDPEMMAEVGRHTQYHLQNITPKAAQKIATQASDFTPKSGKNTVIRVINSEEADLEKTKTFQQVVSNTADEVEKQIANRYQAVEAQIQQLKQAGQKVPAAMINQSKQLLKQMSGIKSDIINGFNEVGKLSEDSNFMQQSPDRQFKILKGTTRKEILDSLEQTIKQWDPTGTLWNDIALMRDGYSKFISFRKLFNIKGSVSSNGQWFDPRAMQRALDGQTNPSIRYVQKGLKDAWLGIKDIFRRHAEDFDPKGQPIVSDQPFLGGKIHMGENVPKTKLRWYQQLPFPRAFDSHIGNVPPLPKTPTTSLKLLQPTISRSTENATDNQGP